MAFSAAGAFRVGLVCCQAEPWAEFRRLALLSDYWAKPLAEAVDAVKAVLQRKMPGVEVQILGIFNAEWMELVDWDACPNAYRLGAGQQVDVFMQLHDAVYKAYLESVPPFPASGVHACATSQPQPAERLNAPPDKGLRGSLEKSQTTLHIRSSTGTSGLSRPKLGLTTTEAHTTEPCSEGTEQPPAKKIHLSSAASLATSIQRDVFLCHAREQKQGIVSHLDSALRHNGITTFLDVHDIVYGQFSDETIWPALKSAKAVVLVISLEFIARKYPMKELHWVLEDEKMRKKAVPVFYNVSRVDCSQGTMTDTVKTQLAKGGVLTMQWMQDLMAIADVGNIDPSDVFCTLSEAEVVHKVVSHIFQRLKLSRRALPEHQVELEGAGSRLQPYINLLRHGGRCALLGEGGIGKTTMANALFNQLHPQFGAGNAASIVVGREQSHAHLLACASKLLTQLGCSQTPLVSMPDLSMFLDGRQVLIVLDDVWDASQLHYLLPRQHRHSTSQAREHTPIGSTIGQAHDDNRHIEVLRHPRLAAGSCVICTSRLSKAAWVAASGFAPSECHAVQLLSEGESRSLLRWHVFGAAGLAPPEVLLDAEQEVLQACGGLPLALEVVGGYIRGVGVQSERKFDVSRWQAALVPLMHHTRDKQLVGVLNLSLSELDPASQDMFFDVACVLHQVPRLHAEAVWSALYGQDSVKEWLADVLNLSLMHEDEASILSVHDVISNLAHQKVRKDARGRWEQQEWLWDDDTAFQRLFEGQVSAQLRALELVERSLVELGDHGLGFPRGLSIMLLQRCSKWHDASWQQGLGSIRALLLMAMHGADFAELPPTITILRKLRVLELADCFQLRSIPNSMAYLTALQCLALDGCSGLVELPDAVLSSFKHLVSLDLVRCSSLIRFAGPGLGNLTKLQHINLKDCLTLQGLPESLGQLTSLRVLCLEGCISLPHLPDCFHNLINLQALDLSQCALAELPGSLAALKTLSQLYLKGCSRLQALPDALGQLTSLQVLWLEGCIELSTLPGTISRLRLLRKLSAARCKLSAIPDGLSELQNLHTLVLAGCTRLRALPSGIGCLTALQLLGLNNCVHLVDLPGGLSNLCQLQVLGMEGCDLITSLPIGFSNLTGMRKLFLNQCSRLTHLPTGLEQLTGLQVLGLEDCKQLKGLPPGIDKLQQLWQLNLSQCDVTTLPAAVCSLHGIRRMALNNCTQLAELPNEIGLMQALQVLVLHGCIKLRALPETVSQLQQLEELGLDNCGLLNLPDGLSVLQCLQQLSLRNCSSLRHLPANLGQLTALQGLCIEGCSKLTGLPESIGNLQQLRELDMEGCGSIARLPVQVGGLSNLARLILSSCTSLTDMASVSALAALQILIVNACTQFSQVPQAAVSLHQLKDLELCDCMIVALPNSLGCLKQLEKLFVGGCTKLSNAVWDVVTRLTSLQSLSLQGCTRVAHIPDGFGLLQQLLEVDMGGCSMATLPATISNLTKLKRMGLKDCCQLVELPEELAELTMLEALSLANCSSLTSLPRNLGNMQMLRALGLQGCSHLDSLPGTFGMLQRLEELWLQVGCHSSFTKLPERIGMLSMLRVLYLDGNIQLGQLPNSISSLHRLQDLDLSGCCIQTCPAFVTWTCLSRLALNDCSHLTCLPDGISLLTALQVLALNGCVHIACLPESISNLQKLQVLGMDSCALCSLPVGISCMQDLRKLGLSDCTNLTSLSFMGDAAGGTVPAFGCLTALQELIIDACTGLSSVPDSMSNLQRLNRLDMEQCEFTCLPPWFSALHSLTRLCMSDCCLLEHLPEESCMLVQLQELWLDGCCCITSLQDSLFDNLKHLRKLDLGGCSIKELPSSISKLLRLQVLGLNGCDKLLSLPDGLEQVASLQVLGLNGCEQLASIPSSISNLQQLHQIGLSKCVRLSVLPHAALDHMAALKDLALAGCVQLARGETLPWLLHHIVMETRQLQKRACAAACHCVHDAPELDAIADAQKSAECGLHKHMLACGAKMAGASGLTSRDAAASQHGSTAHVVGMAGVSAAASDGAARGAPGSLLLNGIVEAITGCCDHTTSGLTEQLSVFEPPSPASWGLWCEAVQSLCWDPDAEQVCLECTGLVRQQDGVRILAERLQAAIDMLSATASGLHVAYGQEGALGALANLAADVKCAEQMLSADWFVAALVSVLSGPAVPSQPMLRCYAVEAVWHLTKHSQCLPVAAMLEQLPTMVDYLQQCLDDVQDYEQGAEFVVMINDVLQQLQGAAGGGGGCCELTEN